MWKRTTGNALGNERGPIVQLLATTRCDSATHGKVMSDLADFLNFGSEAAAYVAYLQSGMRDHCASVMKPEDKHPDNLIFNQEDGPWSQGHWEWVNNVLLPLGLFAAKLAHQLTEFNDAFHGKLLVGTYAYAVVEPAGSALAKELLDDRGDVTAETAISLGRHALVTEMLAQFSDQPVAQLKALQQHFIDTLGSSGRLPVQPGSVEWITAHAGVPAPFKYTLGQQVVFTNLGAPTPHWDFVEARCCGPVVVESAAVVQVEQGNLYRLRNQGDWIAEEALWTSEADAKIRPATSKDFPTTRGLATQPEHWQPSLLSK